MPRVMTTWAARLCASLALAALVTPAHSALRSPQVPVTGNALATFFASQGQTIAVVGDQVDLQRTSVPAEVAIRAETFGAVANSFGFYNASNATPPLYLFFPGVASAGWFVVCSFRTAQVRLVVNLFDQNGALQGTTTYLGADPTDLGYYAQGSSGIFYSQDERNASGAARLLAYNGTGSRSGSTWIACELSPDPGGDFADFIMLMDFAFAPVATKRTTWGRVCALYR